MANLLDELFGLEPVNHLGMEDVNLAGMPGDAFAVPLPLPVSPNPNAASASSQNGIPLKVMKKIQKRDAAAQKKVVETPDARLRRESAEQQAQQQAADAQMRTQKEYQRMVELRRQADRELVAADKATRKSKTLEEYIRAVYEDRLMRDMTMNNARALWRTPYWTATNQAERGAFCGDVRRGRPPNTLVRNTIYSNMTEWIPVVYTEINDICKLIWTGDAPPLHEDILKNANLGFLAYCLDQRSKTKLNWYLSGHVFKQKSVLEYTMGQQVQPIRGTVGWFPVEAVDGATLLIDATEKEQSEWARTRGDVIARRRQVAPDDIGIPLGDQERAIRKHIASNPALHSKDLGWKQVHRHLQLSQSVQAHVQAPVVGDPSPAAVATAAREVLDEVADTNTKKGRKGRPRKIPRPRRGSEVAHSGQQASNSALAKSLEQALDLDNYDVASDHASASARAQPVARIEPAADVLDGLLVRRNEDAAPTVPTKPIEWNMPMFIKQLQENFRVYENVYHEPQGVHGHLNVQKVQRLNLYRAIKTALTLIDITRGGSEFVQQDAYADYLLEEWSRKVLRCGVDEQNRPIKGGKLTEKQLEQAKDQLLQNPDIKKVVVPNVPFLKHIEERNAPLRAAVRAQKKEDDARRRAETSTYQKMVSEYQGKKQGKKGKVDLMKVARYIYSKDPIRNPANPPSSQERKKASKPKDAHKQNKPQPPQAGIRQSLITPESDSDSSISRSMYRMPHATRPPSPFNIDAYRLGAKPIATATREKASTGTSMDLSAVLTDPTTRNTPSTNPSQSPAYWDVQVWKDFNNNNVVEQSLRYKRLSRESKALYDAALDRYWNDMK